MRSVLFFIFIVTTHFGFTKSNEFICMHDDSLKKSIYADTGIVHPGCFVVMQVGQKLPDIFVYDTLENKIQLKSLFKNGKSVIFINGSYTCFIFRRNIKRINKFVKKYKETYAIYFVNVQEAHPITCSPYGEINENLDINYKKGISIAQPIFMTDRFFYAKKLRKDLHLNIPILVDNEYNDFFTSVFAGPNGYLVFSKDQVLVEQRKWYFNKKNKRRMKMHKLFHRKKK